MGQQMLTCLEILVVDEVACSTLPALREVCMPLLVQAGSPAASVVLQAATAESHLQRLNVLLTNCLQVSSRRSILADSAGQ